MKDKLSSAIASSSSALDRFADLREAEANTDKTGSTWGNEIKQFKLFITPNDANEWLKENRKLDIIDCNVDFDTGRVWIMYAALPGDITK